MYWSGPQVTELATVKRPQERAYALQRWQEDGGIMIIGYEMYRNLTQGRNIKSKKLKETFQKTLVDPGMSLCVCVCVRVRVRACWLCYCLYYICTLCVCVSQIRLRVCSRPLS